jgi:hypothetical protein
MTPVDFLLLNRDRGTVSRSDLARLLLQIGHERFGATRDFDQKDVMGWFHFKTDRPRWFYAAALDVALAHGWKLESLDDAKFAVRTVRALDAFAQLEQLLAKLGDAVQLSDRQLVADAWLADTLRKPARSKH